MQNIKEKISESVIRSHLITEKIGKKIILLDVIDSTNDYLKEIFIEHMTDGIVVIANEQLHGKGCKGKRFISEVGKGIYMSLLLSPTFDDKYLGCIVELVAVAICEAIDKVYNIECYVKWLNDIYYAQKKLGGILVERGIYDDKSILVIGMGINVEGIPISLSDIAIAISEIPHNRGTKCQLIAEILNCIEERYLECLRSEKNFDLLESDYKHLMCSEKRRYHFVLGNTEFDGYIIDTKKHAKEIIIKDVNGNIRLADYLGVTVIPCK